MLYDVGRCVMHHGCSAPVLYRLSTARRSFVSGTKYPETKCLEEVQPPRILNVCRLREGNGSPHHGQNTNGLPSNRYWPPLLMDCSWIGPLIFSTLGSQSGQGQLVSILRPLKFLAHNSAHVVCG